MTSPGPVPQTGAATAAEERQGVPPAQAVTPEQQVNTTPPGENPKSPLSQAAVPQTSPPPSTPTTSPGPVSQTGAATATAAAAEERPGVPPQQQVNPIPPGEYPKSGLWQAALPQTQRSSSPPSAPTTSLGLVPQTGAAAATDTDTEERQGVSQAQAVPPEHQVNPTPTPPSEYAKSASSHTAAPSSRTNGYDLPEKGPTTPGSAPTQQGVSAEGERQAAAPSATTGENRAVLPSTPRK